MPTRERQPLPLPQHLGHYELIRLIGHGPLTDVYEARDRALGRTVAIKVLAGDSAGNPDNLWRFYTQATAAARHVHPNIVQIYFVGEDRGHCYYAMEYVSGGSLESLLSRSRALSSEQALEISCQVLKGLAALHRRKLVHGNLQPSNVLVDQQQGRVLLADFGAAAGDASGSVAAPQKSASSIEYRAPELVAGSLPDARSDLYSAGALISRLLNGLPAAVDVVDSGTKPPHPAESRADVREALARIVQKLQAPSPLDRYQSAAEALAALEPLLSAAPGSPQALSGAGPVELVVDAGPAQSAVRATTLVALPSFEIIPPLPEALLSDGPVEPAGILSPELLSSLQGTELQFQNAIAQYERRREWLKVLCREAQSVLADLKAAGTAGDLTELVTGQKQQLAAIREKLQTLEATLTRLKSEREALHARLRLARAQSETGAKRTPMLKRVALAILSLIVLMAVAVYLIWQAGSRLVREIAQQGVRPPGYREYITADRLRPDLSWVSPDRVAIPVRCLKGLQEQPTGLAFIPGRKLLVACGNDGAACLWNAETGQQRHRHVHLAFGETEGLRALAVSPDGRTVALSGRSLMLWDTASGSVIRHMQGQMRGAGSLAFSHDSRILAADGSLWETATGRLLPQPEIGIGGGVKLAFSPTQPWLACFGKNSSEIRLWEVARNEPLRTLQAGAGTVSALAFSPDGASLGVGFEDGSVQIWDPASGEPRHKFKVRGGAIEALAFSTDQRLALAGPFLVTLWDLSAGRAEAYVLGRYPNLAFSDDGLMLAAAGGKNDVVICDLPPRVSGGSPVQSAPREPAESTSPEAPLLKEIHFLVATKYESQPEFRKPLQAAAASLPAMPVSVAPQKATWHEVTLNSAGAGFDVLRLKSPLAEPAELIAVIVQPDELDRWNVVSADRPDDDLTTANQADNVDMPDLDLPARNSLRFLTVTGGKISANAKCFVWFYFKSAEPVTLRIAVHLRPARGGTELKWVDQIGQELGWPELSTFTGAHHDALKMATPTQRAVFPFAPGNPYDRNPIVDGGESPTSVRFRLHSRGQ